MHNAILLDPFCEVLEQSDCPLGNKEDQRDNAFQATLCLEGIIP